MSDDCVSFFCIACMVISKTESANTSSIAKSILKILLDLELEIDGVGGIIPGNAFSSDYLPDFYKKNFVFMVVGVSHSVSSAGWSTTLNSQMRMGTETFGKLKNG